MNCIDGMFYFKSKQIYPRIYIVEILDTDNKLDNKTSNIGNYFKELNDNYSSTDKSLTDILSSFRRISKDYLDFRNKDDYSLKYSDYNYENLSDKEKEDFYNKQLQLLECLVANNIYERAGIPRNWKYIYDLLHNDMYALVEKANRKVVYATSSSSRPVGSNAYDMWNGLQIIDLDIKDKELAEKLKPILFDELKKYNWFLGICLSASGKGIHIWTKITPLCVTTETRRVEYLCNFRHKYSYVYVILSKHIRDLKYTKEDIYKFIDMAMAKPQQGIFISSDKTCMLNANFMDLRLDVNFEEAIETSIENVDWLTHPDLKDIFSKLDWFGTEVVSNDDLDISKIDKIEDRDIHKSLGRKHYKHAQRWQLANTLNALYGAEDAYNLILTICENTPPRELKSDIKTASLHNKPISLWAVHELNNMHGFKIRIKGEKIYDDQIDRISDNVSDGDGVDPTKILNDVASQTQFHIKHDQYLSDIKGDILDSLSQITLLEAGAGYGKTEMIKSFNSRVLLVLPFTSTIKSKIESSKTTEDWLYFYGSNRPSIDDLYFSDKSVSMTIDKFSRLNVFELNESTFDYIVVDESHLLYTSSYRDVMAPTIQRLANCKAKVIMMTGTPTGEMLFFPNIKHIRVLKEDYREKDFNVHMCIGPTEQSLELCKAIAKDIIDNKKILFPTNKGILYKTQIEGLVQQYLSELKSTKKLKTFYYKKSNYGDDSMDDINVNKTIGDNDIIFCTTYLSVGVDILDKYDFSVYFSERWIAQDIEQFANRIRNNDLHINLYLPKTDNTGMPINYHTTLPLDLKFSRKQLLFARDMIQTCNDMILRNNEESKYSPLVRSLLSQNKYLKYDENDCRYYIDETSYKLNIFENRYIDYSKQLEVLMNGMKYYGYTVNIEQHEDSVPEEKIDEVKEFMRTCKNIRYNYQTQQTKDFLDHLTDGNIDIYKELMKGSYEIFKDDKYAELREENSIYATDIEVLERNIPYVMSLYKYFTIDTIKEIYNSCIEGRTNKINYTKLNKLRRFCTIENARKKNRLDFPVYRFYIDSIKFATDNPEVTKQELIDFKANYAAKMANSIKDVVIDDIDYLENMYRLINDLFNIFVTSTRPKNNIIYIKPFELEWELKEKLEDAYGNSTQTKIFFLQDIIDSEDDDIKEDNKDNKDNEDGVITTYKPLSESIIEECDEDVPELTITSKKKLEDVEHTLDTIIHDNFDYEKYSQQDGSNERFMRKQDNTNSLKDTIFNTATEDESEDIEVNSDPELF